jgi:hypothetical protein
MSYQRVQNPTGRRWTHRKRRSTRRQISAHSRITSYSRVRRASAVGPRIAWSPGWVDSGLSWLPNASTAYLLAWATAGGSGIRRAGGHGTRGSAGCAQCQAHTGDESHWAPVWPVALAAERPAAS